MPCVSVNRSCLGTCLTRKRNTTGESNSAAVNSVQNIISLWTQHKQATSISFAVYTSLTEQLKSRGCCMMQHIQSGSWIHAVVSFSRDVWLCNVSVNFSRKVLCFHENKSVVEKWQQCCFSLVCPYKIKNRRPAIDDCTVMKTICSFNSSFCQMESKKGRRNFLLSNFLVFHIPNIEPAQPGSGWKIKTALCQTSLPLSNKKHKFLPMIEKQGCLHYCVI